jgi:two-component system, OmpR family, alkaline phosphatase synthesis response regulator PhoP
MSTILIVDDEFSIIEVLRDVLLDEGYEVVTANNGQEGWASLEKKRPDLVLCDVMMPILDGRELCRRMTSHPRYHAIPLIFMTAVHKSFNQVECNYVATIAKPFDIDEVLSLIARFIPTARSS